MVEFPRSALSRRKIQLLAYVSYIDRAISHTGTLEDAVKIPTVEREECLRHTKNKHRIFSTNGYQNTPRFCTKIANIFLLTIKEAHFYSRTLEITIKKNTHTHARKHTLARVHNKNK